MTAEQIAKKYVHGLHDALTDRQEIKDMITDIETYAERYHQAKLKELNTPEERGEELVCDVCKGVGVRCIEDKTDECWFCNGTGEAN